MAAAVFARLLDLFSLGRRIRALLGQFLRPQGQASRRTIADALDVLRAELGFDDLDHASIRIAPLMAFAAASVALLFDDKFVLLPAAKTFHALNGTERRRLRFDVSILQGATAEGSGIVRLADGGLLKAVEITPVPLPYTATPLDCRILKMVLAAANVEEEVQRSIRENVPEPFVETLPDRRAIDFAKLSHITAPSYKVFESWRRENACDVRVSRQKYEEVITKVGMHVPVRRGRRRLNQSGQRQA